jgi:hypothetical protein
MSGKDDQGDGKRIKTDYRKTGCEAGRYMEMVSFDIVCDEPLGITTTE